MSDSTESSPAPRGGAAFESPARRLAQRGAIAANGLPAPVLKAGKAVATALRKFRRDVFRQLDRQAVARIYLKGTGLEIGALHNPLAVPAAAHVRYVDRMTTADLRRQYPELATQKLVTVDIVDDGEHLTTVTAGSQDFVIANQVLEHCQNPLHTLEQWLRVLKPEGVLFLSLPDKRYSFDVDRPVTTIDHVLRDYREGPQWSRRQHFEEWVALVEQVAPAERAARVEALMAMDYSIHFHVWSQGEMLDLVRTAQRLFENLEIEMFAKTDFDVEHLIVLRKAPVAG